MSYLTSEQIVRFNEEGYVVVEKVIDESVLVPRRFQWYWHNILY